MTWTNFHKAMIGVGRNERMSSSYIKKKGLTDEEIERCINEGLLRYNEKEDFYCLTLKGFNEVWK